VLGGREGSATIGVEQHKPSASVGECYFSEGCFERSDNGNAAGSKPQTLNRWIKTSSELGPEAPGSVSSFGLDGEMQRSPAIEMLVIVGGHSRKVGKTSLIANLIRSLPRGDWTALKISANRQKRHGPCAEEPYILTEEREQSAPRDTSRYLAAGAQRSFWLRADDASLRKAVPAIREILAESRNLIVESNRLMAYLQPHFYLVVVDYSVPDFKDSTRRFLPRASALAVIDRGGLLPAWDTVALAGLRDKPNFLVCPYSYASEGLVEFVRNGMSERRTCGGHR
jgi:hypothetical protein